MQIKNIIPNTIKRLPILTKLAMMLVAAALIPLMFPNNGHGIHYDYAVGGIWRSNNLVAPYDFVIQKSTEKPWRTWMPWRVVIRSPTNVSCVRRWTAST